MAAPDLRASDADRERAVQTLGRHTAAGRLSLDEYAERVDRALAARTHRDLAALIADLPPAEERGGSTDDAAHQAHARQLGLAFLLALLALALIGVLVAATR
jgi:hypothetical protein